MKWLRRIFTRRARLRLLDVMRHGYVPESERVCLEIWERS